jgi:hypothetical protein
MHTHSTDRLCFLVISTTIVPLVDHLGFSFALYVSAVFCSFHAKRIFSEMRRLVQYTCDVTPYNTV